MVIPLKKPRSGQYQNPYSSPEDLDLEEVSVEADPMNSGVDIHWVGAHPRYAEVLHCTESQAVALLALYPITLAFFPHNRYRLPHLTPRHTRKMSCPSLEYPWNECSERIA